MKTIYVEQDEEIVHVATLTNGTINLRNSDTDIWNESVRGKHVGILRDTDESIKIKMGDIELDMDYDDFSDLFVLMELKMTTDKKMAYKSKYLQE
jgi:hypothetical protein